jgi:hypothetical protein
LPSVNILCGAVFAKMELPLAPNKESLAGSAGEGYDGGRKLLHNICSSILSVTSSHCRFKSSLPPAGVNFIALLRKLPAQYVENCQMKLGYKLTW